MIGLSLTRLFAEGIGEHEIIELANLFERSNDADKQALIGRSSEVSYAETRRRDIERGNRGIKT